MEYSAGDRKDEKGRSGARVSACGRPGSALSAWPSAHPRRGGARVGLERDLAVRGGPVPGRDSEHRGQVVRDGGAVAVPDGAVALVWFVLSASQCGVGRRTARWPGGEAIAAFYELA